MAIRRLFLTGLVVAFAAVPFAVSGPPVARAQSAAADSSANVAADSLAIVPHDSLAVVPTDSLAVAPSDSSLSPFADAVEDSSAGPAAKPRVVLDAWNAAAAVGPRQLDALRPESLVDAVQLLPDVSVRVAGDRGMPAFVSLSPVGGGAPEVWVDGVPGGQVVDDAATLYDHGAHSVARMASSSTQPFLSAGDPHLELESRGAVEGRTLLDSQFSRARRESYLRAVRISTAEAPRVLQVDFEEWKTDEGILYAPLPGGGSSGFDGRTKMRRFRLRGLADTGAGQASFEFGRGRRLWPTSVLREEPTERWTGLFAVGLDRQTSGGRWRLRAWHRDVHDDDAAHFLESDAARLGLRVERRSRDRFGWTFAAWTERWSGSFVAADTSVYVDPRTVARASVGQRQSLGAGWEAWGRVETAYAEQSSEDVGLGGGAGIGRRWTPDASLELFVQRQLRTPTLLETEGLDDFDLVLPTADGFSRSGGTTRRRTGAGELPFERQDRLALRLGWSGWGLDWSTGVEHWRLREGIGWVPEGNTLARTVGGLELDVDQVVGQVEGLWFSDKWRLRVWARGHRVIGALEHDASRGAGWPAYASRTRVGLDREFFSVHNRLGFDVDVSVLGPRFDDLAAALGGAELDAVTRLDLRARLQIRDAEMALCLDNALDTEQTEVLGSRGRPRQIRWTLSWPFFN